MADKKIKQDDKEESMEDILHSIKDIISGKPAEAESPVADVTSSVDVTAEATPASDDFAGVPAEEEILELTDVVAEGDAADAPATFDSDEPAKADAGDVLADIDELLGSTESSEAKALADNALDAAILELSREENAHTSPSPSNSLLEGVSAHASTEAMRELLQSIPKPSIHPLPLRDGVTLEGLVIDTMKPMLAEWLNANLPTIVKDLVEKEIRKLVPRE